MKAQKNKKKLKKVSLRRVIDEMNGTLCTNFDRKKTEESLHALSYGMMSGIINTKTMYDGHAIRL